MQREGLDILDRENIHLVLLDIMMPGMDGLEMCRKIRETNNIPIIMLSARSTDLDKNSGTGDRGRRLCGKALQPSGADGQGENPSCAATRS